MKASTRVTQLCVALLGSTVLLLAACSATTTTDDALDGTGSTVCDLAPGGANSIDGNYSPESFQTKLETVASLWAGRYQYTDIGSPGAAHAATVAVIFNCTQTRDLTVTALKMEGDLYQDWGSGDACVASDPSCWQTPGGQFDVNLQPNESWSWLDNGPAEQGTSGTLTASLTSGGDVTATWNYPVVGSNSQSCVVANTEGISCTAVYSASDVGDSLQGVVFVLDQPGFSPYDGGPTASSS